MKKRRRRVPKHTYDTPEFYDRIAKLRRQGLSINKIAEIVGCTIQTMANKLRQRGFIPRGDRG